MSYGSYSGSRGYGSRGYSSHAYGSRGYGSRDYPDSYAHTMPSPVPAQACTVKAPVSPMELVTIQYPSITLKWPTLYPGQKVYMTAGIRIEPVVFLRSIQGQCQVRTEGGGTYMVWRRRLFTTMEEAESFLPGNCVYNVPEDNDTDDDISFDFDSPFPEDISYPTETEETWPLFKGGPSSPEELFSGRVGEAVSTRPGEIHRPDETVSAVPGEPARSHHPYRLRNACFCNR